jgi:hypothetical protein
MQDNERLSQLWCARDALSEAEWEALYKLVVAILKRSNPSILRSLPESKEHYIQDFFLLKVFEPAKHSSSAPHGANELCSYFNNYLIDVYRSVSLRTTDLVEDYDEVERHCESARELDLPPDSEFHDHGLTHQAVYQYARVFLDKLDDVGRIYLALHACADAPEPLYKLAEQYRIPSYHYRALQLGITRKKGEFDKDYGSTLIGQWLSKELGLELSAANPALLAALKILCLESLQQYQQKRSLR